MPKEIKTIYLVQAWDIQQNKLVEFNHMLTSSPVGALNFAEHLNAELKEYYKDIKIITETYELKKRIVEEVKE